MLYLKEILYQVLDRNNVYDRVILLFDDCELANLPDIVANVVLLKIEYYVILLILVDLLK